MSLYTDLTAAKRKELLTEVTTKYNNLPAQSIEKDWWVTMVLRALFSSKYAPHISFKGGTSLSKCFGIIDRFSEDVDIAISREFLGFSGELSKTQV
ncbi:MAG: nucleotidyl transferase AbiEii/AbiGii toxin family protein, partial [Rikenellaceae bacterium]